jgi:hypothetical protein
MIMRKIPALSLHFNTVDIIVVGRAADEGTAVNVVEVVVSRVILPTIVIEC